MRSWFERHALGTLLAAATAFAASDAGAAACTRPTDPGGSSGYDYGTAKVSSFGNDQVLVWYVTQGVHSVSTDSTRSDGVPDEVALVADVTSAALTSYAALGFRAPIPDDLAPSCGSNGGDARLDVYLVNMSGADGQTAPELGRCVAEAPQQCSSFLFAKTKLADYYGNLEVGVRTVLPHETFHAVQNAYDVNLDRFWAEGSAQWAAKALDPELTDLERNLPAFFSQTSRSLDGPVTGVTAGFLYGSAVWPVFLSERYGQDIVRSILEQEGQVQASALAATDVVLQALQSSVAEEYPLFMAWNTATGSRAGVGGYPNAAAYPLVKLNELDPAGASAITSGYASYFYHAQSTSSMQLVLETDATRNAGSFVPFEAGVPRVDRVTPLPAELNGEGIVVVSGITSKRTDAPFTLSLTAPAAPASDGGCAFAPVHERPERAFVALFSALFGFLGLRRRRAQALGMGVVRSCGKSRGYT